MRCAREGWRGPSARSMASIRRPPTNPSRSPRQVQRRAQRPHAPSSMRMPRDDYGDYTHPPAWGTARGGVPRPGPPFLRLARPCTSSSTRPLRLSAPLPAFGRCQVHDVLAPAGRRGRQRTGRCVRAAAQRGANARAAGPQAAAVAAERAPEGAVHDVRVQQASRGCGGGRDVKPEHACEAGCLVAELLLVLAGRVGCSPGQARPGSGCMAGSAGGQGPGGREGEVMGRVPGRRVMAPSRGPGDLIPIAPSEAGVRGKAQMPAQQLVWSRWPGEAQRASSSRLCSLCDPAARPAPRPMPPCSV